MELDASNVCLAGETRRAFSRHCWNARVYGNTTTVMHVISTPPPRCTPILNGKKGSALSSLNDSRRFVPTHDGRSRQLLPFSREKNLHTENRIHAVNVSSI